MTTNITVSIITKDRPELLAECLRSIKDQSVHPDELIVVEDISNNKYFNKNKIFRIVKNIDSIKYLTTTGRNYAISRNIALSGSSKKFLVFVDDDVTLPENFMENSLRFMKNHKKALGFTPKVLPTGNSIFEVFGSRYMNRELYFIKKIRPIRYFAAACLFLNRHIIKQKNLKFREDLYAGEDVVFLKQLTGGKRKFYFNPDITVFHKFASDIFNFLKKHYYYGEAFIRQEKVLHTDLTSDYFPKNKPELLTLPIFMLNSAIKKTRNELDSLKLPAKFFIPSFLHIISNYFGIYLSDEGKIRLSGLYKRNFT